MKHQVENLAVSEFDDRFGQIFSSVFVCERQCRFSDESWSILLLPYGLNLGEELFRGLELVAQETGDTALVVTSTDTVPRHEISAAGRLVYDHFEAIRAGSLLGHIDCCVFGTTGRWGVICANRQDYGLFGAEHALVSIFAAANGGQAAMKQRFLEFAEREWTLPTAQKQEVLAVADW